MAHFFKRYSTDDGGFFTVELRAGEASNDPAATPFLSRADHFAEGDADALIGAIQSDMALGVGRDTNAPVTP